MKQRQLLIATGNPGKVKEFIHILGDSEYSFLTLTDVGFTDTIIEDGSTFEANARIKAEAVARFCQTRGFACAVLADDSGLEVDYLDGAPGVHTARFAGSEATDAQNWQKLLTALENTDKRTARFRCALCWKDELHTEVFHGTCEGQILRAPQGEQGFGYDPVFQPNGHAQSFAEMEPRAKKSLSHRGEAIRALQKWLARHRNNIEPRRET